jgi:hypothetical protein
VNGNPYTFEGDNGFSAEPVVHPKIQAELRSPAAEGERHTQMKRLLPLLLGDGHSPEGIFAAFRSMYGEDVSDREIWSLINWGKGRDFSPTVRGDSVFQPAAHPRKFSAQEQLSRCLRNTEVYLDGFRPSEVDVWEASPIRLMEDFQTDIELLLWHLYEAENILNINTDYVLGKDGKVDIVGAGLSKTAGQWIEYLGKNPAPQSAAGAWIRMNPLKDLRGTGAGGSYTDSDVASYRFILLESDRLPMELQLGLFCRLKLPIALILDSGGRSLHAWVRSWARSLIEYRAEVDHLFGLLERFGIDSGNSNPSRYSRCPGVLRTIGARTGLPGMNQVAQRILYLCPNPQKARAIA